jgi:GAF domain-containing protein
MKVVPDWAVESGLKPRQGVAGLAFAEQRPVIAQDYTTDDRFETTEGITAFVANAGIRAVLAAPLPGEEGPIGVISVVSRTPGVYREVDAELLSALATQASIALVNARLMQALEGSQAVIERRAGSEQALREIATRITAIREPGDLLQHVVEESARLLRADGALLELYDPTTRTLEYAFDAGLPERQRRDVQVTAGKLGEGVSGKAISERRVIVIDDYLTSDEFVHTPANDALAKASSIRSLIAAPIVGEDGPLGTIEVFRRKPAQFDQIDAAVLGGLPTRPRSQSPTRGSSPSWHARAPRSSTAPSANERCATSRHGSLPCATRARCWSGSSRRQNACWARTVRTSPASTKAAAT